MRVQIKWQDGRLAPWRARRVECRGDLPARLEVPGEATGPKRLTLHLGWGNVKEKPGDGAAGVPPALPFSWQSLMSPAAPRNRETALSFRAKRGISLCVGADRNPKNQSEIPRFARNDRALSKRTTSAVPFFPVNHRETPHYPPAAALPSNRGTNSSATKVSIGVGVVFCAERGSSGAM